MNPVRGGRPPNESSAIGIVAVNVGLLAHDKASELIVVVLFILIVRNTAEVIMK